MGQILNRRRAAAEDGVQFLHQPFFDFWVLAQEVEGPTEGLRRGFMSCQEQGEYLIAHLSVIHAIARFLILRDQEHGKEISPIFGVQPPFLNDLMHNLLDCDQGGAELSAHIHIRGIEVPHGFVEDFHGATKHVRLTADVIAEQGPGHNAQGKLGHFLDHFQRLADLGFPLVQHERGEVGHERAEGLNALAVEGGLSHASLLQPRFPFAGEDAFPQHGLEHHEVGRAFFGVVAVVVLQNALDVVGMIDQGGGPAISAVADNVAVFPGDAHDKLQWVAANLLDGQVCLWPWRMFFCGNHVTTPFFYAADGV